MLSLGKGSEFYSQIQRTIKHTTHIQRELVFLKQLLLMQHGKLFYKLQGVSQLVCDMLVGESFVFTLSQLPLILHQPLSFLQ